MSKRPQKGESAHRYVAVVGGANLDIVGRPDGALLAGESNPGTVTVFPGGVGRNVAQNLACLGVDTRLLTVVGQDRDGERIVDDCRRSGVDVSQVAVQAGATSSYLAILDGDGDLSVAVSHMDLVESIDAAFIDDRAGVIEGSSLVIVDANLRRSTITHLFGRYPGRAFLVDTVSAAKARRLKGLIGQAHTIKPNRSEAEVLSGIQLTGRADLERSVRYFLGLGVQRVFISLGEEGLYFGDRRRSGWLKARPAEPVDATGAGDAATAGLAYAYLRGMALEDSARFALAAANLALQHPRATHPRMTVRAVKAELSQLEVV